MLKMPCEIYSRVCGYCRPVTQWNKGKQEEFNERKMMKIKSLSEETADGKTKM